MEKRWIRLGGLVVGLLCALAWYGAILYGIFQYGDDPRYMNWGEIRIGGAISFVAGWGLIWFAAREPQEKEPEEEFA